MEKTEVKMDGAKDFMAQVESTMSRLNEVEEGQVVEGVVAEVTKDFVFLDIGCKSEGRLPITDFETPPKYGDTVQVYLERTYGRDGNPVISKGKADEKKVWADVCKAFKEKTPVKGKITGVVKGGYDVMLGNLRTFLPISQADVRRVEVPESLIGFEGEFLIERMFSDGKQNIVVNRRKLLEEVTEKKREEFFNTAKEGDVLKGTVKSFTTFGAFIDLGGFDGLLHVNDMSWSRISKPRDLLKKGDEIEVMLIKLDKEAKRINVSLKHMSEDPWIHFEDKFHVNDIVEGTVTKFTDFGVFVEIAEGIEGLVHISEMSWTKKINKPSDILKIGEKIKCMILGYDIQAGRVSLGIKQVTKNPWEEVEQKYSVGAIIKGKIVKLTNTAAFINLEEGIDAYMAAEDISWTKKVKHPTSVLKEGEEVEVSILECSGADRRIRAGMKQTQPNPWVQFAKKYKVGSTLEGTISSITDEYGVFVKTEEGIEGLINKSNLSEDPAVSYEDAVKKYKTGDKVNVYITDLNVNREKVGFSVREFKRKQERDEVSQYMAGAEKEEGAYTVGDFVKSQKK